MKNYDICPICECGTVLCEIKEKIFPYKGEQLVIKDYKVWNCNQCLEGIVDKETLERADIEITAFHKRVDGGQND